MAEHVYVVKGLAALVNLKGGFATLFHKGAVLPDNVEPEHLQHLLDQDLVEKGVLVGGLEPVLTGDLADQVTGRSSDELDDAEVDDVDGDGPIPPKSANKDAWVAYAVSKGATQEDAEASTKDDLIAAYGEA